MLRFLHEGGDFGGVFAVFGVGVPPVERLAVADLERLALGGEGLGAHLGGLFVGLERLELGRHGVLVGPNKTKDKR